MDRLQRALPSPAMVVACVALAVALGGTGYAAFKLPANSVGPKQLRKNAVIAKKIKNNAVTGQKIANGAVTGAKLAFGAVGSDNLADGSVTASKLGGSSVGTGNIADNAVTTSKLANGAVTGPKLAANSVSSGNVVDGSLTASDVAPGTFLPENATASDSARLGGKTASAYVQGTGNMVSNRLNVGNGQTPTLLNLGVGHIDASCASGITTFSFVSDTNVVNYPTNVLSVVAWGITYPASMKIETANGVHTVGGTFTYTGTSGVNDGAIFQIGYDDGNIRHVATAWLTGQDIGGTNCIVIGQALTTG